MASDFRTLRPGRSFSAATILGAGETVGVGMPIMINFSRPITDKAAVERALQIWSSKPVTGAWYWVTSESVWFRPGITGPRTPGSASPRTWPGCRGRAPGVFGKSDLAQHFRIGDSLIAVASTGRPGMDTPAGRYLSFAKGSPVDMNSASYGVGLGIPGYYNELVYDAVKFTFSGDYVHSAPRSVGEQGISNVSHGCVNLAPGYAAWFYGHSMLGDPISVVGSPSPGPGVTAGPSTSSAGAGCSPAAPPGTRCWSAGAAAGSLRHLQRADPGLAGSGLGRLWAWLARVSWPWPSAERKVPGARACPRDPQ
jgi:lipoprotein-anchoring transpeptidase ErfK/SrfK